MELEGVAENSPATLQEHGSVGQELPSAPTAPSGKLDRRISGRAVASSILGLIAISFSWFPLVNLLALILGIIGLKKGIRGFKECNRTPGLKGITPAIIGAILCSIAIIIVLIFTYWIVDLTLEQQSD